MFKNLLNKAKHRTLLIMASYWFSFFSSICSTYAGSVSSAIHLKAVVLPAGSTISFSGGGGSDGNQVQLNSQNPGEANTATVTLNITFPAGQTYAVSIPSSTGVDGGFYIFDAKHNKVPVRLYVKTESGLVPIKQANLTANGQSESVPIVFEIDSTGSEPGGTYSGSITLNIDF